MQGFLEEDIGKLRDLGDRNYLTYRNINCRAFEGKNLVIVGFGGQIPYKGNKNLSPVIRCWVYPVMSQEGNHHKKLMSAVKVSGAVLIWLISFRYAFLQNSKVTISCHCKIVFDCVPVHTLLLSQTGLGFQNAEERLPRSATKDGFLTSEMPERRKRSRKRIVLIL